ncbi:MAG: hypothetical protein WCW31_05000 [Patescibacteria group bacterium]|jgi:hypothetical protein
MPFVRRVKNKLKLIFVDFLIKVSLFWDFPRLTAYALALATVGLNPKKDIKVLCIGRSIFLDDVTALIHFGSGVQYLVLNMRYWYLMFDHFIPERDRQKITESNYHKEDFGNAGKQKYNAYLSEVLPRLKKLLGFNAVFAGNFGYLAQQEISRVCETKKIPFIVLHKEGLLLPGDHMERARMNQTYKFMGAKLMFYNKNIKQALLDIHLAGIDDNNTKVVGVPRLDFYFENAEAKKDTEKQVVFFSFSPSEKFMFLISDQEALQAAYQRSDDFHKWVMNFALKHKDFKVIIKTKYSDHYLAYVQEIFNKHFGGQKIDNLVITNNMNPFGLITNSNSVMGFNSTTLIEAIVAQKNIITPFFGDLIKDKPWDYFLHYPELVNYAKTEAELESLILNPVQRSSYTLQEKNNFLNELISVPDGQASLRVEKEIIDTVNDYKKYA